MNSVGGEACLRRVFRVVGVCLARMGGDEATGVLLPVIGKE